MKKYLFLFIFLLSFHHIAKADQNEIDHLLDFVQTTDCQYERNGVKYNGEKAVNHIKKKYQYFKDNIKTSEDFIRYSATKSKMSGRHYHVYCVGQKRQKSKDWLLNELVRYRQQTQP